MRQISDETLVESYFKALDLELESDFVDLLLGEINRRHIVLETYNGEEAALA
ncbi:MULTISPECIES: sporulation histidine kinase inhibitor Sda [Paenibacillus]|uniref:Sporulation histidine kinase inhibitor Sda n=1 Tax=Paenibacillus lutrae TaxID=2078573 RepID=A0A7X3FM10_9BACL|nr:MULTISPECIES: sporulation histidine kinase inhibitor Sda [Paenibacillus]MVP01727.1 sporulation histidine kinase inhibitor Sda [Paenibacillus lutrae]